MLRRDDEGSFGLELNRFARVRSEPDPAASAAGAKRFDRIIKVNGMLVAQTTGVISAIEGQSQVELVVERPPRGLLAKIAEHENASSTLRPFRRHKTSGGSARALRLYDPDMESAGRRSLSRAASRLLPSRDYLRTLSATFFARRGSCPSPTHSGHEHERKGSRGGIAASPASDKGGAFQSASL